MRYRHMYPSTCVNSKTSPLNWTNLESLLNVFPVNGTVITVSPVSYGAVYLSSDVLLSTYITSCPFSVLIRKSMMLPLSMMLLQPILLTGLPPSSDIMFSMSGEWYLSTSVWSFDRSTPFKFSYAIVYFFGESGTFISVSPQLSWHSCPAYMRPLWT